MYKYYRIAESLPIEYEYDKGPMPSGYARVALRITPKTDLDSMEDMVIPEGRFWEESKKYSEISAEEQVPEFLPTIIEGVRQGMREALEDALDHPIREVSLFLDKIVIDPVYSTKMAFRNATKLAIQTLLADAQKRNLIKLLDHE